MYEIEMNIFLFCKLNVHVVYDIIYANEYIKSCFALRFKQTKCMVRIP